ncbi:Uncharacterised protein [Mycobacteroides abscessus subsp. abscessus]|nr:Uncharacterised protein [Mycobacteroides abscessus subsp. abscessus]
MWCTMGTELMKSPTIRSTSGSSLGRPDTIVPKTTSVRSVSLPRTSAQANAVTVFSVSPLAAAHCRSRAVSSGVKRNCDFSGTLS